MNARSLYGSQQPIGTKLLTCLRVGLSHLRVCKFSRLLLSQKRSYIKKNTLFILGIKKSSSVNKMKLQNKIKNA